MDLRDPAQVAALLEALAEAQTAAARLVEATGGKLEPGMHRRDVSGLIDRLAKEAGVRLVMPPRVGFGTKAATLSPLAPDPGPLVGATLVTLDLQVQAGEASGDYARTLQFGDDGRLWFYRRLAYKIYDSFREGLPGCKNEREAWALAHDCSHREGARLLGPAHTLGHHLLLTGGRSRPAIELLARKERLEHLVRARLPLGVLSPKLSSVWSLEPVFEIDRHTFRFEDLYDFTGGTPRRVGEVGGWEG